MTDLKKKEKIGAQDTADRQSGAVMVVGGGIAGIQSSLDLADSGFKVYLLEQTPAIGGTMAQLDKTFPTNDCAMCVISPKLVGSGRHLNIDLVTNAELMGIEGEAGNFTVKVKRHPRYVDSEKCTGCGACVQNCPVSRIIYAVERDEIELEKEDLDIVMPLLENSSGTRGSLMPVLQAIDRHYGYLPKDVIRFISGKLEVGISEIYNIATFYNSFSLVPKGRHKISICMGTTCYVKGAEKIMQKLCRDLGTEPGGTTEDLRFSVEAARCIGCCSLAPAIMINDRVYGRVKLSDLSGILKEYE
jgi:NADH:ubiquinone oxidoreductase subunit E/NAD-dependent dihydropyrimidine dehydrogenase PreA subunit